MWQGQQWWQYPSGHAQQVDPCRDSCFTDSVQDRNIILWNPHSGVRVKTYVGHGYDVRDASVSSDNAKFASCGGDKQAGGAACGCSWRLQVTDSPSNVNAKPLLVLILTFSVFHAQVFLWDVSTGRFVRKFKGHDAVVNAVRPGRTKRSGAQPVHHLIISRKRVLALGCVTCAGDLRSQR